MIFDPTLLEFKESNHSYAYDGERIDSVTSILGIIAKPSLQPWSAKLAADRFAKDLTSFNVNNEYMTVEDIEKMRLRAVKSIHIEGKDGARLGTLVHQSIEEFMADQKPRRAPASALGYMRSFHDWWDRAQEKYECIAIEQRLYHPKWRYCGTADLVMRNRLTQTTKIIDFKTSKRSKYAPYGVYPEYLFQIAAYSEAWNATATSRRDSCVEAAIVNLCPDGGPVHEITRDTFDLSQDFQMFRLAQDLKYGCKSVEDDVTNPKKRKSNNV